MPRRKRAGSKRTIDSYAHTEELRDNNPPVGLVTPDTDLDAGKKTYAYDPHLDPQLQWAGKEEHTSFEVPTVSLHVHERIDPRSIVETVRKRNGSGDTQLPLFEAPEENPPLRQAIEFSQHRHNWSNRLVAGDSLLVMNSLLEKEGMAGKVQTIYIDPPYGISYGSNFQPFVNRRTVKDGRDEDLTNQPEQIRAFRDTWELGIHSYLSYLRDRLFVARELLAESGSCFVQISDENIHHVREIMDELFGSDSFVALIAFRKKTMPLGTKLLEQMDDFILWHCRDKNVVKYRPLFYGTKSEGDWHYQWAETEDGSILRLTDEQIKNHSLLPKKFRLYRLKSLEPSGPMPAGMFEFELDGQKYAHPRNGFCTTQAGMKNLELAGRLSVDGKRLAYKLYEEDSRVSPLTIPWQDTIGPRNKVFAVQTSQEVIQRCILMTSDPGDLVLDPTCGSGTTALVAEQWGRRWITCDTSRVALALARQRLMTATYDFYELAHPKEGVGSGFNYKVVHQITLGSIANNPEIREGMTQAEIGAALARYAPQETLYDQPLKDRSKSRVTGPFTVEAVPAPSVKSVDDVMEELPSNEPSADIGVSNTSAASNALASAARSGETLRQVQWRDELKRTGIRAKAGQYIRFARLEPLPGSPKLLALHADGESLPNDDGATVIRDRGAASSAQRIVVSFGPEHAPLEQRQVELALEEAQTLRPSPKLIVFAAFQFDPEAAKDIDETKWPGVTLLKAQMNPDLLTEDLKKKRASNESFWLIGQPDVLVESYEDTGETKHKVTVHGFDYYNTKTGEVESGGADKIAVWLLDTDYDGRSLYPRQVFFPMAGPNDGWARLAKNLKAEIDAELIEAYRGTVSLPFESGEHNRIAVKIVDDRGIESLRIIAL